MAQNKTNNPLQTALIGLLIVAAFLVGSLWTKVKTLEGGKTTVANNQAPTGAAGQVAGEAAGQPEKTVLDDLPALASSIGLDQKAFSECLDGKKFAQTVTDDAKSGTDAGISGTPGVVLLDTKSGKTVSIPGAVPIDQLKSSIDQLIAGTAIDAKIKLKPVSADDHIKGDKNARILLVEYSDIQCSYCKRFYPTVNQALNDYNGQIALVYRHFPLEFHPLARPAAEATECAASMGGNDAFWKMLDKMNE